MKVWEGKQVVGFLLTWGLLRSQLQQQTTDKYNRFQVVTFNLAHRYLVPNWRVMLFSVVFFFTCASRWPEVRNYLELPTIQRFLYELMLFGSEQVGNSPVIYLWLPELETFSSRIWLYFMRVHLLWIPLTTSSVTTSTQLQRPNNLVSSWHISLTTILKSSVMSTRLLRALFYASKCSL